MNKHNNFLKVNKQELIHYFYSPPTNNLPIIVFLPGYMSNIKGKKAFFLKELCNNHGYGYLTFDYRGHGDSSGNISNYSLLDWLNDVIFTINSLSKDQKMILVGSSMGGWLSFLYALKYPNNIASIVGIAPALDFTEDIKSKKDSLIQSANNNEIFLLKECTIPNTTVSKKLLQVPEEFLLLRSSINLNVPIRLLHGLLDNIVLYSKSLDISQKLLSADVIVYLIKNADHSLSSEENLSLLGSIIHDLVKKSKVQNSIPFSGVL